MPRPLGQGLGQFLAVPRVHAEQDLMGQNGPRQIILGRDRRQQLRQQLIRRQGMSCWQGQLLQTLGSIAVVVHQQQALSRQRKGQPSHGLRAPLGQAHLPRQGPLSDMQPTILVFPQVLRGLRRGKALRQQGAGQLLWAQHRQDALFLRRQTFQQLQRFPYSVILHHFSSRAVFLSISHSARPGKKFYPSSLR